MGYFSRQLRLTFALRFGVAAVIGSVAGTVLAVFTADTLVSAVMQLAGISDFHSNPGMVGILFPAVTVILMFTGFAYLFWGKIKKVDLTVLITE